MLIFSGAGLSAESGISTFRDNEDGLWTKYDPMVYANISTFSKYRKEVFEFYNERRNALPSLQPNRAHSKIAELQKRLGKDVVKIFTQNIDDFLERAGCEEVVHVHGRFTDMQCLDCYTIWDVGYNRYESDEPCPHCRSTATKPGVVFFGEKAPAYEELYRTFARSRRDAIVVIGTAGDVVPMERVTGNRYSTRRSYTILNNKEHGSYGSINYNLFDSCIFKPATEAIDEVLSLAEAKRNHFLSTHQ